MNLSSVNVDVLLQLTKFMSPTDRLNAFIAGVLPGTENIGSDQSLSGLRKTCVTSYKIDRSRSLNT
jgi:hypothetical protein